MKYPVYCIRDVKVGFRPEFLIQQNDATAIRGFSYAVNNDGMMNFSPKDYDLYKIGEFDLETGNFQSQLPDIICSGVSVYGVKE